MLLSQALPAAINIGKSAVQAHKAKELAKTPRPQYQIPEAITQGVNNAKYFASQQRLPGQSTIENRLGRNLASGISDLKNVSTNAADLGSNVAKLYSSQNDAINDLGIAAANNYQNNQGALRQQLGLLGNAQNYQFDYNQNQPYQNNMAASSALREGSFRNLSAAGQNIANGLSGYGNLMYQQDLLDQFLGKSLPANAGMPLSQAVQSPTNSYPLNGAAPDQDVYSKILNMRRPSLSPGSGNPNPQQPYQFQPMDYDLIRRFYNRPQ